MASDSPNPVDGPDSVFQVPKDTTPTWEVELLLSGALVFSMLQVPGWLDEAIYSIRPRLTGSLNYGAFMLYFYLKITIYALIVTFVLHLASRAIWVAALGLRSVYPNGVLWDKLPRGPIYREYIQRTTMTLDQMIERADNRASLVFAFGLLVVVISLTIMCFTMLMVVVSAALSAWIFGSESGWQVLILVAIVTVPVLLATLIDRRYGERIPPHHWLAKVIRVVYRVGALFTGGRAVSPMMLTIFSRLGVARSNVLMLGGIYSLMGLILLEVLINNGKLSLPGERYLPEQAQGRELLAANYASTRSQREALEGYPFIASEVVRGPFVRLFVPYLPRRLDSVIARDCPAVANELADLPAPERRPLEAQRTTALLECAASLLHPVQLNGQPVSDLRYDVAKDPVSGLRGFVAMLDVRNLPPGRHELHIAKPKRDFDTEVPPPDIIAFWR